VSLGEDLSGEVDLDPGVLGMPFSLEPWEPYYVFKRYAPFPDVPRPAPVRLEAPTMKTLQPPGQALPKDRVLRTLVALPECWVTQSHGEVDGAHVRGSAAGAFNRAGHGRGGLQPIALDHAVSSLASASAMGGGHGYGDGVVAARQKCWQLLAALADYNGPLPYPTEPLANAGKQARFYRFVPDWKPYSRWIWELHIGIERPASGEAWALTAGDTD
jgi:hypothetical protein